jgi:hypothetical protein
MLLKLSGQAMVAWALSIRVKQAMKLRENRKRRRSYPQRKHQRYDGELAAAAPTPL